MIAFGRTLFGVGSVEALSQVASELEPPRIRNLQRTARLVCLLSLVITGLAAVVIGAAVPDAARAAWLDAPLAGLAAHLLGPPAVRVVLMPAVVVAAVLLMMAAVRNSMAGVQGVVSRLIEERLLSPALQTHHPRYGTPWRVIDATALIQIGIVLVSAGQPAWLVAAYAVGLLWSAAFKIAALIRFRSLRRVPPVFRVPFNITIAGRVRPIGLWLAGVLVVVPSIAVLAAPDAGTLAGSILILALSSALLIGARARRPGQSAGTDPRRVPAAALARGRPAAGGSTAGQSARAGPEAARPDPSRGRPALGARSRRRGDDRAHRRHRRSRRSVGQAAGDRRRAAAAVGGRRAGRASGTRGSAADCARRERLRYRGRDRAAAGIGGDSRRRIGNAAGPGTGAAARRGVGARVRAQAARRPPGHPSSDAAPPPPISSARTRRRSTPAISI